MLFDNARNTFESEKERNLYFKIFAGYFFNELILGYEKRLQCFCDLINHPEYKGDCSTSLELKLNPVYTHVSFDNHLKQFSPLLDSEPDMDMGEFADIFIQDNHDVKSKFIVTIEAKLHSDWRYEKDIEDNLRRIYLITNKLENVQFFPVLLVTKAKWDSVVKLKSHHSSNYSKLLDRDPKCPFRVVLWEQFYKIIDDERVKKFLLSQIHRSKNSRLYESDSGWFTEKPNIVLS